MMDSFVVRPVGLDDLPKLVELLGSLEHSLTSMPRDEGVLEKRIHKSIQSFYPGVSEAGSEQYLFVMEEQASGRILGTSSVIARVGGYEPFYTYLIKDERLLHEPLGVDKLMPVLHLQANHDGPTEIGSLFLHPQFRKGGLGRLLSLTRFLFMARFRIRFRSKVIAELRGYVDEKGRSPFWDHVGRHFFDQEFDQADFLSGIGNKAFIRDLMPRHPIYLQLLPLKIQNMIGMVHPHTEAAKVILLKEGFEQTRAIDIFDAGPMLEAKVDELKSIRYFKTLTLSGSFSDQEDAPYAILGNSKLAYSGCVGKIRIMDDHSCEISANSLSLLGLSPGESIDCVSF